MPIGIHVSTPSGLQRFDGVALRTQLLACGVSAEEIADRLASHTWRTIGPAIVLHYGPLTARQRDRVVLLCHPGPAVLTSFTALQRYGLRGWQTEALHVLAGPRVLAPRHPELPLVVTHQTTAAIPRSRKNLDNPTDAALRATGSLAQPRRAIGLIAAAVGQGIVRLDELRARLHSAELNHLAVLREACSDMLLDGSAFDGLDLADWSRSHRLPAPIEVTRRQDSAGRWRQLDATWRLPDGAFFVLELDAALHLAAARWWEEEIRAADLIPNENSVLRMPLALLRTEPTLLALVLSREFDAHRAAS